MKIIKKEGAVDLIYRICCLFNVSTAHRIRKAFEYFKSGHLENNRNHMKIGKDKTMKKKIYIGTLVVVILWGIMFFTDYSRSLNFQNPVFVVEKEHKSNNENTVVYQGLGYSVQVRKQKDVDNKLRVNSIEMELFGIVIHATLT